MKSYIAYYISSHGFGHLTRSLALIEHMLNKTDYCFYVCSAKAQIEFAQIYLEDYKNRILYSMVTTDVGLVTKDKSLDVDLPATELAVENMLRHYRENAQQEAQKLENMDVKLIVSDVSAFACAVSEICGIKLVEIGNFTWTDQYISIGAKEKIIDEYNNLYSKCEEFIAYDLSLPFKSAPKNRVCRTNFIVSRPIIKEKVQKIRKTYSHLYNIKTGNSNPSFLYLSLGKSAEFPNIKIKNFCGVVFYTQGIAFNENDYEDIFFVKLPNEIKDSQSFVAAADLVVAKAGWSTTAEALAAHSKLLLIERNGVDDDMNTINTLKSRRLAGSIKAEETVNFDYKKMLKRANESIDTDKLKKIENDVDRTVSLILSKIK